METKTLLENAKQCVTQLKPAKTWGHHILSQSDPNTEYTVYLFSDRFVKCSCPGYLFHNYCKHSTAAILVQIAAEEDCDVGDLSVYQTRRLLEEDGAEFVGWFNFRLWIGRKQNEQ